MPDDGWCKLEYLEDEDKWWCRVCDPHKRYLLRLNAKRECGMVSGRRPAAVRHEMPPLATQAWNLATAMVDFVADGCKTVDADEYRRRLEICDGCEYRKRNRCSQCGCTLSLKARGRAFRCPMGYWEQVEIEN